MKNTLILVCLLFCFSNSSIGICEESLNKTDPVLFLTLQNYRVLSGRIHKMLEYRLSNLSKCPTREQESLRSRFSELPKFSDDTKTVLETLNLYKDSFNTGSDCKTQLDLNEMNFKKFEREKFSSFHNSLDFYCSSKKMESTGSIDRRCFLKTHQIFSDLDPHCVSVQVPNFTNDYDTFPCMMADYLIGRSMVNDSNWNLYIQSTQEFINRLRAAFSDPQQRAVGINLWAVFRSNKPDTQALREEFLAQLNFLFSSSQSASSYIRGFHDHIWQFVLRKTQSAEMTLSYFLETRIKINEFIAIFDWADKNNFQMNINGIAMKKKNRHNYMAAYLACHYRNENRAFHDSLPVLLGFGYESLDFKSHIINEHYSLPAAKENFVTDTNRYRTGVYWGYRFCNQQF